MEGRLGPNGRPCDSHQWGVITSVNQKTDSTIRETLTSVGQPATAVGALARSTTPREGACRADARLYNVDEGVVDPKSIIVIP